MEELKEDWTKLTRSFKNTYKQVKKGQFGYDHIIYHYVALSDIDQAEYLKT